MNADFLFASLNVKIIIKKARKRHILWMKVQKQGALNI